jgi:hypothetical protein
MANSDIRAAPTGRVDGESAAVEPRPNHHVGSGGGVDG